jgi:DNA-binding response OmpR family regulator
MFSDDPNVLSMIVKHLRKAGYDAMEAVDGLEALRKLHHDEYDLIITDLVIPYISGLGVVSALKPGRIGESVRAMIKGYIIKPCGFNRAHRRGIWRLVASQNTGFPPFRRDNTSLILSL